jgi:hypothetical protein
MQRPFMLLLVVLAAVAIVGTLVALRSCQSAQTARTESKLAKGQAGAALQSGSDAVETIGNASAREAEIHTTVQEVQNAINTAPAGDSNDAAVRAACRLRSYRHQPKCVALLGPVAE